MKLWNKLNGKKTLIGTILGVLYVGAVSMNVIEQNGAIELFILTVFGVGVGHKIVKSS